MSASDRLAALLLMFCLAVVALLASFASDAVHPMAAGAVHPMAAGAVHPEFGTLRIGGNGGRSAGTLVRGWLYGAVAIAFFAASFALAVQRPGLGLGPMRRGFWWLAFLYQAAWLAFIAAYAGFVEAPAQVRFLFAFPLPTSLMLYLLWPFPALFMLLYLRHFLRFVWTDRDQAAMDRLIAVTRGDARVDDG